ncbi:MAG: PEP-CTERM sorting domain-containing protein [Gemmatimonadales bacterium]|nr:PEP-CTERM sorting domain-containing protein [Gemmatimonadales bacterium]
MSKRVLFLAVTAFLSPAALHAGRPAPPPTVSSPTAGAYVVSNLTWTNQCSTGGSGGQFFPTCASASLNLYSNNWLELLFWNRAGFGGTFSNAAVKAIGLGGLATPTGTQGGATGWDAGFGGTRVDWDPEGDIPGPNTGNGFRTNGNGDAFCSGAGAGCPGGITTPWTSISGGGSAAFYWFIGAGLTSLNANAISLQLHSGSGPNGWSTGFLCLSDGAGRTVVEDNETWTCADNMLGDPAGVLGGTAQVTPEPATMTLIATGLAGMAAARRRRRSAE